MGNTITLGKNLKRVGAIFVAVYLISFIPVLSGLHESLVGYISVIWWAVLLGFFLGGIIDYFVSQEFIFSFLGKKRFSSLVYAVFAGLLLSACSHGILALSVQLYKKGANIASVVTFLLASPWANLPITILLFSFFGVIPALLFVLAAMLIALVTGSVFLFLEKRGWTEASPTFALSSAEGGFLKKEAHLKGSVGGVFRGAVSLANMVLWWILIGVLIGAVIGAYIPADIFHQYLGPTFTGLLLTLLFATIIEVCSEGSAPIAFEIFNQVGTFGNPFVFLMAGVVTDYTEIGLLWSNIGKKTAIWLPIITVPQVLLIGYLFNIMLG